MTGGRHPRTSGNPRTAGGVRIVMKSCLQRRDELVRATLVDGLEDAGIQVTEFLDPQKALSPSDAVYRPDLVITDV
jgi:PleD family two-component response regulator